MDLDTLEQYQDLVRNIIAHYQRLKQDYYKLTKRRLRISRAEVLSIAQSEAKKILGL